MLVKDVMLSPEHFPVLKHQTILKVCLEQMTFYSLGIATVVSDTFDLLGVFTDGDLRRILLKIQKPIASLFVDDVLDLGTQTPLTVSPDDTLESAIKVMKDNKIWDLRVTDSNQKLVGLLHLHPAVEALLLS